MKGALLVMRWGAAGGRSHYCSQSSDEDGRAFIFWLHFCTMKRSGDVNIISPCELKKNTLVVVAGGQVVGWLK